MSTFVVNYETINKIQSYLSSYGCVEALADFYEQLTEQGIKMLKLNIDAYDLRYGFKKDYSYAKAYEFKDINVTPVEAYKALECLLYQCNVDNNKNRKLYRMLRNLRIEIANHIVRKLPEYEEAGWNE